MSFFTKGLVVPVLRNVQDMDYADIEKGINALGQKAKANQLSIEVGQGLDRTTKLYQRA